VSVSTSTRARRACGGDAVAAARTSAVTSNAAREPAPFGTLIRVHSRPRSPPGLFHGLVADATSHVAWLATNGVVTSNTPTLRAAAAPPQCTVIVSAADCTTEPDGIAPVRSKSRSALRTNVGSDEARVTRRLPSKLVLAYVPPRIVVSAGAGSGAATPAIDHTHSEAAASRVIDLSMRR